MTDGDRLARAAKGSPLEREFHGAMVDLYREAKLQANYTATYFIQMVSRKGGLESARGLLFATKPSDGFAALWERGRLDLTVEALVLEPRFESLFTEEERDIAHRRLLDYGYAPRRDGPASDVSHDGGTGEGPGRQESPPADHRLTDPPAEFPAPRDGLGDEPAASEGNADGSTTVPDTAGHRRRVGESTHWDFFISYTQSDQDWAEWIAWNLEDSGYQVLFQAWDFVPGSHWMERMGKGIRDAERTLAVLSHTYLSSVYGKSEWHAAYRADPQGFARKLIPVRIEDCPRPDLLGEVVSFDLFGLTPHAAQDALKRQISVARSGRAKPSAAPHFPNRALPPGRSRVSNAAPKAPERERREHSGKYRTLWAWLESQETDYLPTTFGDVEKIIGSPLPPSARKHPAHWSGYDGSAVARAIRDAGWTARQVDLVHERLVFVRAR